MKKILYILLVLMVGVPAFSQTYSRDAIHKAAYDGNLEMVLTILRSKPDVEMRDTSGSTALHSAMFQDSMAIIESLIGAGYNINAIKSMDGNTPLHEAVRWGNMPAVKLLVEKGADINIKNFNKLTPMALANKEGDSEIVEYLKSVKK